MCLQLTQQSWEASVQTVPLGPRVPVPGRTKLSSVLLLEPASACSKHPRGHC